MAHCCEVPLMCYRFP